MRNDTDNGSANKLVFDFELKLKYYSVKTLILGGRLEGSSYSKY